MEDLSIELKVWFSFFLIFICIFAPLFLAFIFEMYWIISIQLLCWGLFAFLKERQWDRMKQQNNN